MFAQGDELALKGIPPATIIRFADTVRASFPRGQAIIYYNEASFFGGPRHTWVNGHTDMTNYTIPKSLDWFGVDLYHYDGPVKGWAQARVGSWYRANVYPNISAQQKVVLVPGAFGSTVNHFPNGTYVCDRHCYDEMCTLDAHEFYAWAKSDERVVAIAPWNWGGCPGCNGSHWTPPNLCCMDEIGAKDQPKTRAAWERIGDEIKDNAKAHQGSAAPVPAIPLSLGWFQASKLKTDDQALELSGPAWMVDTTVLSNATENVAIVMHPLGDGTGEWTQTVAMDEP